MEKLGKSFVKIGSRLQIAFFYFFEISCPPPVYSEPPAYLILPNFLTPPPSCLLGPPVYLEHKNTWFWIEINKDQCDFDVIQNYFTILHAFSFSSKFVVWLNIFNIKPTNLGFVDSWQVAVIISNSGVVFN